MGFFLLFYYYLCRSKEKQQQSQVLRGKHSITFFLQQLLALHSVFSLNQYDHLHFPAINAQVCITFVVHNSALLYMAPIWQDNFSVT